MSSEVRAIEEKKEKEKESKEDKKDKQDTEQDEKEKEVDEIKEEPKKSIGKRIKEQWQLILKIIELVLCALCLGFFFEPARRSAKIAKHHIEQTALIFLAFTGYMLINAVFIVARFIKDRIPFRISSLFSLVAAVLFVIAGILLIVDRQDKFQGIYQEHHFYLATMLSTSTIFAFINAVLSILCTFFVIIVISTTAITKLDKIVIVAANVSSVVITLAEVTYTYIIRSLSLNIQVLCSVANFFVFSITTTQIYWMNNNHNIIKCLFFLNGVAAVLFLVDLICRILISTYLYRTTRVKSVVDVAVSAFFPPPSTSNKPKPPHHRSILTTTPITYGGTFPIGKDQPPFLAEERFPPNDGCQTPERGTRSRSIQTPVYGDCRWSSTPLYGECRGSSGINFFSAEYSVGRIAKSKCVQTFSDYDEKGTSTVPPLHGEEERRKKSPWTCTTPTSSKKLDARKQTSWSTPTPITYSGTFAVDKELVPITPGSIMGSSPKSSPRSLFNLDKSNRKNAAISRSEGNSPVRSENLYFEMDRLDQISEEKSQFSSENCSFKRSTCTFFDSAMLPGSVIEENDQMDRKNLNYFIM